MHSRFMSSSRVLVGCCSPVGFYRNCDTKQSLKVIKIHFLDYPASCDIHIRICVYKTNMSMYMCIYTYTCMRIHEHAYIHTYIHTYMHE